jgi:hypothetical protein
MAAKSVEECPSGAHRLSETIQKSLSKMESDRRI